MQLVCSWCFSALVLLCFRNPGGVRQGEGVSQDASSVWVVRRASPQPLVRNTPD
jgi:hypothetical protein